MNIDNPAALHFIMQDDIFLLNSEKSLFGKLAIDVVGERVADAVIGEANEKTAVAETVDVPARETVKHKGSNTSGYVVLVHYPGLEFMLDAHLTALESTFKRKGVEPDNVVIVNMAALNVVAFELIAAQLRPRKVLIMGKNALPADTPPIKFNQLNQLTSCTVLHTFSFDEMMDNSENKKIFWEQMKLL